MIHAEMLFCNIILPMSLTGGVMIAAVLLVRLLFKRWRTHGILLLLWIAACAMLLVPFRPSSPASIYGIAGGAPAVANAFTVAGGAARMGGAAVRQIIPLPMIWLAGVLAVLTYNILSALLLRRRFRTAVPRFDLSAGQRRKTRIYMSSAAPGPMTYGILRPRVILPMSADGADGGALTYMLLHELQHIRNRDALLNLLWLGALCIHWFNPLVWISWVCLRRDMETRCDAKVLGNVGAGRRAGYAQTLLDMVPVRRENIFPLPFGSSSASDRIKCILAYRPATKRAVCAAMSLAVCCVTLFASNPAALLTEQIRQVTAGIAPSAVSQRDAADLRLYRVDELPGDDSGYQAAYTLCEIFSSYAEARHFFAEAHSVEPAVMTGAIVPKSLYRSFYSFAFGPIFTVQSIGVTVETGRKKTYYELIDAAAYESEHIELAQALNALENRSWHFQQSRDDGCERLRLRGV